jgi:hypothetical protein
MDEKRHERRKNEATKIQDLSGGEGGNLEDNRIELVYDNLIRNDTDNGRVFRPSFSDHFRSISYL